MPAWTFPPVLMLSDSRMQKAHLPLESTACRMGTRDSPLLCPEGESPCFRVLGVRGGDWDVGEKQMLLVMEVQWAVVSAKLHLNMKCRCLFRLISPRPVRRGLSYAHYSYCCCPWALACAGVCHWAGLHRFGCLSFPVSPHTNLQARETHTGLYTV